MNEPTHDQLFHAACDLETCPLIQDNVALREELKWALSWFNASARRSHRVKDHYDRAVRLTGAVDPQAWRDGMVK